MKFKLTTEYLYWWPVTIKLPDETLPGKWTTQTFTMQFAAMTEGRGRALQAEIEALPTEEERNARKHDVLLECARDWRDVTDEHGQPVEFSRDALNQALGIVWFRMAILTAWARSLAGEDARRGN